ncbi:MAG: hypothetical protein ACLQJR_21490 [Stellaceae bacterium]
MPREIIPFTLQTNTTLRAQSAGRQGPWQGRHHGAPAASMNAVVDPLAPLGIVDIDMPATPDGA